MFDDLSSELYELSVVVDDVSSSSSALTVVACVSSLCFGWFFLY